MQTLRQSMHETKKPPYLTQCLRGKGDEIELAFEKSADILFRYFHWVMAVEACTADRQIADHVLEFLDRHVAKRVGSDLLADLLRGVRACDQLFVRRNIGAEIARIQERRRACLLYTSLSGGHLSGTRSDDEGRAESLSLPGSADSACQR